MPSGLLLVEGVDDAHTILHFLCAKGWSRSQIQVESRFADLNQEKITIRPVEGVFRLLDLIDVGVEAADGPIAIVIDADDPEPRWQQLKDRFKRLHVFLPSNPQPEGFIGSFTNGQVKVNVGLWMMPNNGDKGGLEEFLQTLVPPDDPIYLHAVQSTNQLVDAGMNLFSRSHQPKAELRAYLAWQDKPGCAYGNAVSRKYFAPDMPAGNAFANWFGRVFGSPGVVTETTES